ncbi:MAG TPA: hypothetical protein V6C95_19675 [Coleofasciculaceae cyanobacterium]
MNQSPIESPTVLVHAIADRIIASRRITRTDQNILMSALLSSDTLTPEEQNLVQQIYKDLRLGLIRVTE